MMRVWLLGFTNNLLKNVLRNKQNLKKYVKSAFSCVYGKIWVGRLFFAGLENSLLFSSLFQKNKELQSPDRREQQNRHKITRLSRYLRVLFIRKIPAAFLSKQEIRQDDWKDSQNQDL